MNLQNKMASAITREYLLAEDDGIFITFDTAQEAFDWADRYIPNSSIDVCILGERTLTEGEIEFTPRNDISCYHTQCGKCGKVFNDVYRMYYPCPEHPPV